MKLICFYLCMLFNHQRNLCALAVDSVPFPVQIYVSIQRPQLEQKPFLRQLVLMPWQQLIVKLHIRWVLTENNSSRKERCRSKKSRENILLRASENSMRWSSVCWIGACWRSSCTAFSEWKRVSESLNLLSGEHGKLASPFPWGSYQKGGINLI